MLRTVSWYSTFHFLTNHYENVFILHKSILTIQLIQKKITILYNIYNWLTDGFTSGIIIPRSILCYRAI